MIATLINVAAVLAGGGIGLLFKGKIPKAILRNITRAIGLFVCYIGFTGAIEGKLILLVVSIALGTMLGESLHIDGGLNRGAKWLEKKLSGKNKVFNDTKRLLLKKADGTGAGDNFAEGFMAAVLLFCVGAMSIVGSIESGLNNDMSIILTKSVLDGISAIVLASTFGYGVLFSAVVILIYQGSIELLAGSLQNVFADNLITQISAAGGVMILAIGLNMTLNTKIKAANMLPGLLIAALYFYLFL